MAKRSITRKSRGRPRSERRKRVTSPITIKALAFLLVALSFTVLFYNLDRNFFDAAFRWIAHRPTQGDFAGNLILKSINAYHSIAENGNNKDRLLQNLSDPVIWYNRRYSYYKFPSESPYDRFEFISPLEYDHIDRRSNSYEIRFNGVYRYRHPKEQLVKFESGTVIIENGLITSLVSIEKPNAYTAGWLNWMYHNYWLCSLLLASLIALVLLNLHLLPEKFVSFLIDGGRKILRL